jgi:signal transduction histidine kinase
VVKDPARIRTYGEVILDQSRRLGGMIEDVLSFAGATARERTRREDDLDLGVLVDEVLAALASTLHTRNVGLERQVPDELPAVRGDAGLLRRAIQNLVENAVKHGGDAPWVAVRLDEDRAGGQVVLTVEDRGPGIDPADLPHLFDPFYRGQAAQARQVPGFGLGLALVKRTIEDHGGRISVQSSPGRGSTFTLRLPMAPTAPVAAGNAVDGLPNPSH